MHRVMKQGVARARLPAPVVASLLIPSTQHNRDVTLHVSMADDNLRRLQILEGFET